MEVRSYREALIKRQDSELVRKAVEVLGNFSLYLMGGTFAIPANAQIIVELQLRLQQIGAQDPRRAFQPLRDAIAKRSSWQVVDDAAKLLWSDLGQRIHATMTPRQRNLYWQIVWDAMVCLAAAAFINDTELVDRAANIIEFVAPAPVLHGSRYH